MVKSNNNVVTFGLSGKTGDLLIFRQKDGKTIVAKIPQTKNDPSDKQLVQRRQFQKAVLYAKAAVAGGETAALYEAKAKQKKRNPFHVAVADFMKAPDITHIDLTGYAGQAGDVILIEVSDDFAVKRVSVSITNADGTLVETGDAIQDAIGYQWTYTATQTNDNLDGDRIVIRASDTAGNITDNEQNL
jgi:spore germination protein GerM